MLDNKTPQHKTMDDKTLEKNSYSQTSDDKMENNSHQPSEKTPNDITTDNRNTHDKERTSHQPSEKHTHHQTSDKTPHHQPSDQTLHHHHSEKNTHHQPSDQTLPHQHSENNTHNQPSENNTHNQPSDKTQQQPLEKHTHLPSDKTPHNQPSDKTTNHKTNPSETTVDLRKFTADEVRLMRPKKALEKPFEGLVVQDGNFLDELDGRSACVRCGKSRKYFCYTCYVPLPIIEDKIPRIKLPFKIDVLKHPKEIDGKSTAVHAALIAPDDVSIYTYPDLPDYTQQDKVLLIFPDKKAVRTCDLPTLFSQHTNDPPEHTTKRQRPGIPFTKAVFIDCTWNQTRKIYNDERVRDLPCVELDDRETLFWRYQRGKPNTYLATIEAIYYFIVDVHTTLVCAEYKHEYDNLLFFFKYMFEKIHSIYDADSLRAYKDVQSYH